MKEREVFSMLEGLSLQDASKREETLLGFAKGLLERELSAYGLLAEMTDEGVKIMYGDNPKTFPNLASTLVDGFAPSMVRGYKLPYAWDDCTETGRIYEYLSLCAAIRTRLKFLDWLNDNHLTLHAFGLVIDAVDLTYVFLGTDEKHPFLASFTDMRTLGSDYAVDDDGIDDFFGMIEERGCAQIVAIKRQIWHQSGIDIEFKGFEDGKYAVSANIRDEDGHLEICDWSTGKEAYAELGRIYDKRNSSRHNPMGLFGAMFGGPNIEDILNKARKATKETYGSGEIVPGGPDIDRILDGADKAIREVFGI